VAVFISFFSFSLASLFMEFIHLRCFPVIFSHVLSYIGSVWTPIITNLPFLRGLVSVVLGGSSSGNH
jgi:hypothetical protein